MNTLIFLLNYNGEGSVQRDRGHEENVRLVGFSYPDKGFVVHEICLINFALHKISNSNWTEWSTIQGVIGRVISKSAEREVRGRFEITSTITP